MREIRVGAEEQVVSPMIQIGEEIEMEGFCCFRTLSDIYVERGGRLEAPLLKVAPRLTIHLKEGGSVSLPTIEEEYVTVVIYSDRPRWTAVELPKEYALFQNCNGGNGKIFRRRLL